MTVILNDVGECVDAVLRRVGSKVVLALPLGIGKPNPLANEFYRRAARDASIDLTIITALSLRKPVARTDLERRLLEPIVERVFGNYPELEYVHAMRRDDDKFIYEIVVVPSFQDALIAVLFNFNLQACVIRYGFPLRSRYKLDILGNLVEGYEEEDIESLP